MKERRQSTYRINLSIIASYQRTLGTLDEVVANLDSHPLEVLDGQRWEVIQPVVGIGELLDVLVAKVQRPHDVPLEGRTPSLGYCFALKEPTEVIKTWTTT